MCRWFESSVRRFLSHQWCHHLAYSCTISNKKTYIKVYFEVTGDTVFWIYFPGAMPSVPCEQSLLPLPDFSRKIEGNSARRVRRLWINQVYTRCWKITRFNSTWASWMALKKQSNLFTSISECIYRLHIQKTWSKLTKLKKYRNILWLQTCILECAWIYRLHMQNKRIRTRKQGLKFPSGKFVRYI